MTSIFYGKLRQETAVTDYLARMLLQRSRHSLIQQALDYPVGEAQTAQTLVNGEP